MYATGAFKVAFLAFVVVCTFFSAGVSATTYDCLQPLERGQGCRGHMLRFAFNATSKKCEAFIYGGCRANGNNFRSLQACHDTCSGHIPEPLQAGGASMIHVKTPHCRDPPQRSSISCKAFFPRYTFNKNSLTCDRFIYGGCGGTANLYYSLEECMTTCYFGEPVMGGPVRAVTRHEPHPRGHSGGLPMPSIRGRAALPQAPRGAPAVVRPDAISISAKEEDICSLPPVNPTLMACLAFMPKWTHDRRQGKCVQYVYGGCGGTKNLFNTEDECKAACPQPVAEPRSFARPRLCEQPPTLGPIACNAYMPMFTFNATLGQCVPYVYGGCRGSENLFKTEAACQKTCDPREPPRTADVCSLPKDPGPCRMMKPSFAFNSDTKRCEKFFYGGCKGNANRFGNVEDCVNTCGGLEPEDKGVCSTVECDKFEANYYKAKGCRPRINAGDCCPTSWDCSVWEQRMSRKNECFWAGDAHPNGKFYASGEPIPEADHGCHFGCMCAPEVALPGSMVTCAMPGCMWPETPAGGENCVTLFSKNDACCASDIKCDSDLESLAKCEVNGETFYAGQKVEKFPDDPCKRCWCGPDGELTCKTRECDLGNSLNLLKGCVPVFRKDKCCPVDWLCPKTETNARSGGPPMPSVTGSSMVVCPRGVDVLPGDWDIAIPNIEVLDRIGVLDSAPVATIPIPVPTVRPQTKPMHVCLLPQEEGPCGPYVDQWYFDQISRGCQIYKAGSDSHPTSGVARSNRFATKEKCEETCSRYIVKKEEVCKAKEANGPEVIPPASKLDRCMPRSNVFRFNQAKGICEDYSRWGCRVNKNSYGSLEACEAVCRQNTTSSPQVASPRIFTKVQGRSTQCNLPVQTGTCRSLLRRYYYDQFTATCRLFMFTGCQGNGNNFVTEADCVTTCVAPSNLARSIKAQPRSLEALGEDACTIPKESGRCRAKMPKFYFDHVSKVCRLFFYGGCGGNSNRFATYEECKTTCSGHIDLVKQKMLDIDRASCKQPPPQVSNLAAVISPPKLPRWIYNETAGKCERVLTTDRKVLNFFETRDECRLECELRPSVDLLSKVGAASATATSRPRPIMASLPRISPAPANANNGGSSAVTLPALIDPCVEPKRIGRCRAAIQRWYYDQAIRQCTSFFYGGCGANGNNFATKLDCQSTCRKHLEQEQVQPRTLEAAVVTAGSANPICDLPVDVGPCKAMKPKYFYNGQSGKCERFIYGGCKGNENKFDSLRDCITTCSSGKSSKAPGTTGSASASEAVEAVEAVTLPATNIARELSLRQPRHAECTFSLERFNLGDVLVTASGAATCECSTPPDLTCRKEMSEDD